MTLVSSLKDITVPEKEKFQFRGQESADERVQRQKQEFFTLLTAQLQNQDPLSPMETNDMTQQIFAINHVEQQLETNKILNEIRGYFSTSQNSSYLNYVGKLASFVGNEVHMIGDEATLEYELLDEAKSASVQIRDRFGNVVDEVTVPNHKGMDKIKWKKPPNVKEDKFTFSVRAVKHDDSPAAFNTYSYGHIDSLYMENGDHYFEVNNRKIPAKSVKRISDNSRSTNAHLNSILNEITEMKDKLS